jgi:hypothetical protein
VLALAIALAVMAAPNMPAGWTWPPSTVMKSEGTRCLERLDALGVRWRRAPPTKKIATPIVVDDMTIGGLELRSKYRKGPFAMDCHLAEALAEVAPAVRELGIVALRFSTIHDYRTIRKNGRRSRILSRHALGLAMDFGAVVLADGSLLDIEAAYPQGHEILLALERTLAGSSRFRTPLTPGNDPKSHDDHFHIEAQPHFVGVLVPGSGVSNAAGQ